MEWNQLDPLRSRRKRPEAMTSTTIFKVMRAALLGLIAAPLALLGAGHEANAYPFYGQTESKTCAAAGNDRMLRAALRCPHY